MDNAKFKKHFLLGSGSKRRFELLKQICIEPDLILTPNINEEILADELPQKYVERMSIEKNKVFQSQFPEYIILTADTIVSVGRRILPKTYDIKIAEKNLNLISGRRHKVFTSFTIYEPNNLIKTRTIKSVVKFKRLHQKEINFYLESNEWKGKAGSYAIQGFAASFVNFLSGSYSNIVGLPLAELYRSLISIGVKF